MTTREEFAEMLAQAHELRLLRAVADAARVLHDAKDVVGPFDPEWIALGAALAALDGAVERDAADELSREGQDMRLDDEPRPYNACWGPDVDQPDDCTTDED